MPQARVGKDRNNVSNHVEQNINGREHKAAGLHNRDITLGDVIDQILPHAGINEHHFDDDYAHNEISKVEHDNIHDRCNRIRESVTRNDLKAAQTFEFSRLDISGLHHIQNCRAGHAHHMRKHDKR